MLTHKRLKPPYCLRNTQIRQVAANLGYRTVMWTIDTLDWQQDSTPERILQIITANLTPGTIIFTQLWGWPPFRDRNVMVACLLERLP